MKHYPFSQRSNTSPPTPPHPLYLTSQQQLYTRVLQLVDGSAIFFRLSQNIGRDDFFFHVIVYLTSEKYECRPMYVQMVKFRRIACRPMKRNVDHGNCLWIFSLHKSELKAVRPPPPQPLLKNEKFKYTCSLQTDTCTYVSIWWGGLNVWCL